MLGPLYAQTGNCALKKGPAKAIPEYTLGLFGTPVPKKSKRELAALGSTAQPAPLTLADVAKQAGVSPITASRALNRPELVHEATRESTPKTGARFGNRL